MIYNKILDKLLWLFVTLLLFSFYAMGGNSNGKYIQTGITILIAVLCILRYREKINLHIAPFHFFVFLFLLFCCISYSWTLAPGACLHWCLLITQSLLCLSIVYIYAEHQNSTLPLLDSIRWAGYLLAIYLFVSYGWENLHYMLQETIRLDSNLLNSNIVGMICAFSIILTLYRWLFVKFSVSYLFVIPTFLLFVVSNSRKAFAILTLGFIFILSIKYIKRNFLSNIINGVFIGIIGCLITYVLLSLPMLAGMKERLYSFFVLFSSSYDVDLSV